ncbi:3,4-dihydroxy-2-butanone-4-phosphate synthase [uncultured Tateyamaria sp.]|uniref:3,4-dihydroxy-2-butanone-4-phosphate synthase n=1 Tax=Tateyamaria sp. 1078 TaxID=3417464 RepID=UPI00261FE323|nr:3,4-dihydroxy-2-butanone-4-phosphate synthase [uncultured Tateyamaria sp.]
MSFETPGPVEKDLVNAISPIEEIIEEARQGRMFVLVDHEDRENEGDLVIPADFATPEAVNFMATHGRGLICLTLPAERIEALGLPMMAMHNSSRHETAFTVSIEAREGVSTGISAGDRARTIATAINPQATGADIATPGHVFPLRARKGGVLVRAGHTEAGCDVARLAGHYPSSVICEIMKEDGEMARLPDLVAYARTHGLKIGTISDLIAYRRRHDNLVVETDRRTITSQHGGDWDMRIFTDQTHGIEHVTLSKGDLSSDAPVLVRTHALNEVTDILGLGPKPVGELPRAMEAIAAEGRGVVCLFREPRKALFSDDEDDGPRVVKNIGLGAQMLSNMGLTRLILLTNSPRTTYVGLSAYDLEIVGTRPIPGDT